MDDCVCAGCLHHQPHVASTVHQHNATRADQLWGIIARKIATEKELHTAEDAVRVIQRVLHADAIRSWIGPSTRIIVMELPVVRDWRNHLGLLLVELKGGLLLDVTANHVFFFVRHGGV